MNIKVGTTGVTSKSSAQKQNELEERIAVSVTRELSTFPLTSERNLQQLSVYLRKDVDVELTWKQAGSLILTVHCRTLEILERLWEDYCSGHLDEVVEECFLTDEITKTKDERRGKSEADVDTIGLETTILREDYLRCKKFLTEMSGRLFYQV